MATDTLFTNKDFVSHSGLTLPFKMETASFTDEDWLTLSKIITAKFKFREVYGIPSGGDKLATLLQPYITNNPKDPILIVDDVMTTGKSFKDFVAQKNIAFTDAVGVVVFSRMRRPRPVWIHPIFQFWDTPGFV